MNTPARTPRFVSGRELADYGATGSSCAVDSSTRTTSRSSAAPPRKSRPGPSSPAYGWSTARRACESPAPAGQPHRELLSLSPRIQGHLRRRQAARARERSPRRGGRPLQGQDQLQARGRRRLQAAPGSAGRLERLRVPVRDGAGRDRREATEANGCLELAAGHHTRGLDRPRVGTPVGARTSEGSSSSPAPTRPGDAVFFDSSSPHRSGPNLSDDPRRVLYVTYSRLAEGDHRAAVTTPTSGRAIRPTSNGTPGQQYVYRV